MCISINQLILRLRVQKCTFLFRIIGNSHTRWFQIHEGNCSPLSPLLSLSLSPSLSLSIHYIYLSLSPLFYQKSRTLIVALLGEILINTPSCTSQTAVHCYYIILYLRVRDSQCKFHTYDLLVVCLPVCLPDC